ncbi:MAG: OmpA family protein [Candidatus Tenebribacter davisii]|nr:OmpA family protein [Candidatus Tenebribacter davisii]
MSRTKVLLIIISMVVLISSNVFAQIFQRQIFTGIHTNATKLIGGEEDDSSVRILAEFNGGYYITRKIGVGIEAGYGFVTVRDKDQLMEVMSHIVSKEEAPFKTTFIPISVFGRYNLIQDQNWIPYLTGGMGMMKWNCENTEDFVSHNELNVPVSHPSGSVSFSGTNFIANIGGGIEWEISRTVGIDFGIKYQRLFNQKDDMSGESTTDLNRGDVQTGNLSAGFGITLRFGGWRDSDGDEIEDKLDKCPFVPEDFDGFEDEDGCPEYDNDGDALVDSVETNTGIFISADSTGTDPNVADTDMDGINDYEEIYTYKTNPVSVDTDADSLSDGDEVNNYNTDPANADTDNDTLNDGDEVLIHMTDPNNADTDGDGFMDAEDKCPLKPETFNGFQDDDGCPDKKPEIIFEKKSPIVLEGVNFKVGSAELKNNAKLVLDKVVRTLKDYNEMHLEISGHTDSSGSRALNMKLSRRRAEAVRRYLINQGIKDHRLRAIGLGPDHPVTSNKTKEGRAKNRRIEFFRTK